MAEYDVDALILAGSGGEPGAEYRPGKLVAGRPMISYVVEAIKGCPQVRNLAVAGPEAQLRLLLGDNGVLLAPGGSNVIETLQRSLTVFHPQNWLLVATADVPMVTSEALNDFLSRCQPQLDRFNMFYSIVRRDVYECFSPKGHRTYARFKEGNFTGGNVFLVRPEIIADCCERGREIMRLRKSPMRLARLVGLGVLVRYILGLLSLEGAEKRFSALLGVRGKAVPVPYAQIGFDLDREEHFIIAEELMTARP